MRRPLLLFIATLTFALRISAETLTLGRTGTAEIDIPQSWTKEVKGLSTARGIEYQMHITAPEGVKAKCIITLIAASDEKPMSRSDYRYQVEGYSEREASKSVEKKPPFKPWTPKNGTGEFCVLTDDWLATRETGPEQYRYEGLYFARYQNGCVLIATALVDDVACREFLQMRQIFESIVPKLHVPKTGKIKVSRTENGTLFYTNTNATAMLVPSAKIIPYKAFEGARYGATHSSSYFMYFYPNLEIYISGWFFPEEAYCFADASEHWKADSTWDRKNAGGIEYKRQGNWDVMLCEALSHVHARASTIRNGTWIDLHLSAWKEKTPVANTQKRLLDFLAAIELVDKK